MTNRVSSEPSDPKPSPLSVLASLVERGLWRSRLVMMVGVMASLGLAVGIIFVATIDVLYVFQSILGYGSTGLDPLLRTDARVGIVTNVIKAADSYLIAAIVLLFALGLYELFIQRIAIAGHSESAPRLLNIESINDLKDRIAKLILLVLVIEFFQYALQLQYTTPRDLLMLAVSILFIGTAIFVSNLKGKVSL